MKVKFITSFFKCDGKTFFHHGFTTELDDKEAKEYIEAGFAQEIKEEKEVTVPKRKTNKKVEE